MGRYLIEPRRDERIWHTFTYLTYHLVFSTKGRIACISPELKPDLSSYLGGIIRELGGKALIINGTEDHTHALTQFSPVSISEVLRLVKTNSSKWVHEQRKIPHAKFGWQTGYGAFTVSKSNIDSVYKYIADQEHHHEMISFQEEFLSLLKHHGKSYDERYIWE
jgi:REP element-mobilizing transposase RayT